MSSRLPSEHQAVRLTTAARRQTSSTDAPRAARPGSRSAVGLHQARAPSSSSCVRDNFALHVHGVADLHRLLEDGVAHPAQGHDPLGVERQQARRRTRAPAGRGRSARRSGSPAAQSGSVCCGCQSPVRAANSRMSSSVIVARRESRSGRPTASASEVAREESAQLLAGGRRAHAALSRRKRFRIARRNSRAAWRCPSAEGWKPSAA